MFEEKLYHYIDQYSHPLPDYLNELMRETALTTVNPFMSCGPVMGRFLIQLSNWIRPDNILEIGSFTGYSALCMAQGLSQNGSITCVEVNEEYESIIRKYFDKAKKSHQLQLVIGDALEKIKDLAAPFDLVFIDAGKQHNESIYELVLPRLAPKGVMLVDNTLWYGNILSEHPDKETQIIKAFNQKIRSDTRVKSFILPIRDGITLIQKT